MKKASVIIFILFIGISLFVYFKKPASTKIQGKIYGAIVPHHGFAKDVLNTTFKKLKSEVDPKVIVIYGTNHYFPISDTFTTTSKVKEDYGLENVLDDDNRILGDHSIGTVTLYIKEYFPNAKIIPILVSTRYKDLLQIKDASKIFIHKFKSEDTLYLASVDFAHNVSLDTGLKNNQDSIDSIQNFSFDKILSYDDTHMDSPTTISVFLSTMQNLNATHWDTWESSHGALITGDNNLNGTSYVSGVFKTIN